MVDQFTAQLTPDTITTISGQYFDLDQPFAVPRYGNECTPYTTGKEYMKAVADAIRGANKFIFITDWQLDYDVELDNRGDPKHPGRLSELLAEAIQRGVHIRILCYDSIAAALDTHDDTTQAKLNGLPKGKGSIQVMLQNPNTTRHSAATEVPDIVMGKAADTNAFFSHHQKSVVVDGQVAFVGGLDLAYGRWDTNAFDVVIDRKLHVINDGYNMQISCTRKLNSAEEALTQESGDRPGFQRPYKGSYGEKLLDESYQPRQPWQDVAVGVKGPAAFDVFVNFVLRWNSFAGSGTNSFDASMNSGWFEKSGAPSLLVDPLKMAKARPPFRYAVPHLLLNCAMSSSSGITITSTFVTIGSNQIRSGTKSLRPLAKPGVPSTKLALEMPWCSAFVLRKHSSTLKTSFSCPTVDRTKRVLLVRRATH